MYPASNRYIMPNFKKKQVDGCSDQLFCAFKSQYDESVGLMSAPMVSAHMIRLMFLWYLLLSWFPMSNGVTEILIRVTPIASRNIIGKISVLFLVSRANANNVLLIAHNNSE